MKKKILTIIGAISLVCFSFYYTDRAVDIMKKNDPIMKAIVNVLGDYEVSPKNAVLINNHIIPGIAGEKINVDASYTNMKRLGTFDSSMLVFEEIIPTITTINNYDKYIINGNTLKNEVSIIFPIKNTSNIEEILKILSDKNIKATFFMDNVIFDESLDIVKLIFIMGHNVESYGTGGQYDANTIKEHRMIVNRLGKLDVKYCYLEYANKDALEICKKESLHTIIPSIIASKFPYSDVKNNIDNGAIIKLDNSKETVRELNSIINYILQKGYKIVALDELLQE